MTSPGLRLGRLGREEQKAMIHNKLFRVAASLCLFSLCTAPLFGQAVFSLASSPTSGADIGAAELTGQVVFAVTSGTSSAAAFILQYSAMITNNSATEILVTGTGGLAGIASHPTFEGTDSILINVPAGGAAGDQIRIQGVRVALAGGQYSNVTAIVGSPTGSGNSLAGGSNLITVVSAVLQPFTVDVSSITPLAFSRGTITNGTASFVIREGYANAFTSAVGTSGQTVPTSIRLTPYPAIPAGLSVTFPATVNIGTGAGLNTSSGADETIPRSDGSTAVVYKFTAAGSSSLQIESFTMTATLTGSSSQTGVISFQAALIPIGIAVPSAAFPSTDIPRYSERLVPDASVLPGSYGSVHLAFPFRIQSDATYTGIALTNPLNTSVNVTFTPYDTTGNTLANPKTLAIPANSQISELATDPSLFGPNFNIASSGTIVAVGNTPVLPGFYLLGDNSPGTRLDGATADLTTVSSWVWPTVFHQAPTPFTTFELFNPSASTANVTLNLFDSNGTQVLPTATLSIPASGSVTQSIQQIFPSLNLGSLSGGYVIGQSDTPVVARETFGNALDSNVLPGQPAQALTTFFWPHFASGAGYTTELTFINLSAILNVSVNLTISLLDTNGNPIAQTPLSVPQSGQVIRTIGSLFPALDASTLTTGYVRVDVSPIQVGPFVFTPLLAGSLRFSASNGSGSAALPLVTPALSEFVYSHVAESAVYYTGIAMLNTNTTAASVSVQVFTAAGTSVGTTLLTLQPGQRVAELLHQLMPATAGQSGGWIHILSNQPISSFSLYASYDGLSLAAIPPQNIGN
jgi:hypothetical protein